MFVFEGVYPVTRPSTPWSEQDQVTAECFQPPPATFPRAWERVAIAPLSSQRRQLRIWKRVSGPAAAFANSEYVRAMTELARQGQGSKKRTRQASHVPVWGDAKWDPRVEDRRDGKWDLIEARASIPIAKGDSATAPASTGDNTTTKAATFPEDRLTWVPRKRHNSRWPIEPKKENPARMVAESQPLIEYNVPPSPEVGDVSLRMDDTQMRKRPTRRLSKRFTLIPGDGSPRKLPMNLSAAKNPAPALSPVKRPPIPLSPTKVTDSPLGSFRMNATPTKVVLDSPKTAPPGPSPLKPSGCSHSTTQVSVPSVATNTPEPGSPTHLPASPVPLLFDQPTPEIEAETKQEARRRFSLQSARRNDRGSNGISRLLALKNGRKSPNRRHSFTSVYLTGDSQQSTKNRRNTLDSFGVRPNEVREALKTQDSPVDAAQDGNIGEFVEIDMKTSHDIFVQPTKPIHPAPQSHINGESEAAASNQAPSPLVASVTDSIFPVKETPAQPDALSGSPRQDHACVTGEERDGGDVEAADPCQAATWSKADHTVTPQDSPQKSSSPPLAATVGEPTDPTPEEQHQDMFTSSDPERLSTIYEESSIMADQDSGMSASAPVIDEPGRVASPQSSSENEPSSEDESSETLGTPQSESSMSPARTTNADQVFGKEQQAVEGMADVGVAKASTNHVATVSDALSPSDSPQRDREASLTVTAEPQTQGQTDEETALSSSPTAPLQDSDICGAVPLDLELEDRRASPERPTEAMPHDDASQVPEHPGTSEVGGSLTQQEGPGFTPINGRQISPTDTSAVMMGDATNSPEAEPESCAHESDEGDDDDDDEVDVMVDGEGLRIENDTLQLRDLHEDSETEMLRKFVTRVAADKNAKAAAAAAALAEKTTRRKRRAGSTDSVSSTTGSPVANSELDTPANRKPLGEKSPNSPSKKRKLDEVENDLAKDKGDAQNPAGHSSEEPQPKRRRKRIDPVLEIASAPSSTASREPNSSLAAAPTDTASSTPASSAPGPRRSTRTRSTRVALRPTAPSANSIALSMIPVRLPGMGAMDDEGAAIEAHLTAMARQRSAEKDLAAVTRANTRKNKAGAVMPKVVLQRQAEDPNWRMRELKGVWDAKEKRKGGGKSGGMGGGEGEVEGGMTAGDGEGQKKGRKGKGVRWAEDLVRYQDEEQPEQLSVITGAARQGLGGEVVSGEDVDMMDVDEIAEAAPMPPPTAPAVKEKRVIATTRKAVTPATSTASAPPSTSTTTTTTTTATTTTTTRRTRSFRLQTPTPVEKLSAAAAPTAGEKTKPKPASSAAPARPTRTTRALPRRASSASASASASKRAPAPVPTPSPTPTTTAPARRPAAAPTSKTGKSATAASAKRSPASTSSSSSSSSSSGMATRRTRIAGLGMSGNGTPAPKRRGRSVA
ncbi:hypothetical protein VTK26DRAFT_6898 [Humicola hyalothermophila]